METSTGAPITIEAFMDETQKQQALIDHAIETTLITLHGFNVGQQFFEEVKESYQIMYKTFLTAAEDDKSDLIELLTFRAEHFQQQ